MEGRGGEGDWVGAARRGQTGEATKLGGTGAQSFVSRGKRRTYVFLLAALWPESKNFRFCLSSSPFQRLQNAVY